MDGLLFCQHCEVQCVPLRLTLFEIGLTFLCFYFPVSVLIIVKSSAAILVWAWWKWIERQHGRKHSGWIPVAICKIKSSWALCDVKLKTLHEPNPSVFVSFPISEESDWDKCGERSCVVENWPWKCLIPVAVIPLDHCTGFWRRNVLQRDGGVWFLKSRLNSECVSCSVCS